MIIVVAVDGSSTSERALEVAVDLARYRSAELVLAYARNHGIITEVDRRIAELELQLEQGGLRVSTIVKESFLGEEAVMIAEVARDLGADLIVVGSRGRTPVTGLVLGSVSQRILHETPCPTLIVPEHVDSHVPRIADDATATDIPA